MKKEIIDKFNGDIRSYFKENPIKYRKLIGIFSEGIITSASINDKRCGAELLTAIFLSKSQQVQYVTLMIYGNIKIENPQDYEVSLKQFKRMIKDLK